MSLNYICGFAAVNNGKHCWINGHCVVCRAKKIPVRYIEPPVSRPYDPKTYRLLSAKDIIIYKPNSVSYRKRIISA